MAQRLATEYVNATLQMTEFQMNQLLLSGDTYHINYRVKVLESGEPEIVLTESGGEEVHLPFSRHGSMYVCELSCRIVSPHLNNAVRKLFVTYKGTGTVNRIYQGFIMTYYYVAGSVRKISEVTSSGSKLIYQHKHSAAELLRMLRSTTIEEQITALRNQADSLLDERNAAADAAYILEVDRQLAIIAKKLIQLEA